MHHNPAALDTQRALWHRAIAERVSGYFCSLESMTGDNRDRLS